MEDYREVTDKEKANIESKDAAWSRPPQSFIDYWNKMSDKYGCFNEETGYFELNGLLDIGYNEAQEVAKLSGNKTFNVGGSLSGAFSRETANEITHNCRTVFPIQIGSGEAVNCSGIAQFNSNLEVLRFCNGAHNRTFGSFRYGFYYCSKLREIQGVIRLSLSAASQNFERAFSLCAQLREIRLLNLGTNVAFSSGNLSLESFRYMISNKLAAVTSPINIAVHPNVLAKITDETNTEWHALMELAEQKNITFSS